MHAGHERKENEREREARARVRERDGTQNVQTAAQQQEQSRGLKASSAAHGAIVCKLANFSYGHLQAGSLVRLILCQIDSPARPPDIAVGTLHRAQGVDCLLDFPLHVQRIGCEPRSVSASGTPARTDGCARTYIRALRTHAHTHTHTRHTHTRSNAHTRGKVGRGESGRYAEDGARTREGRGAQRPRRGGSGGERAESGRAERVALDCCR